MGAVLGVGFAAAAAAAAWRAARPAADLTGKGVLVTGASRGLGLLLARGFGACGARVVICARDRAELDRAVEDLGARGVDAHALVCDLRDPGETTAMMTAATAHLGRLDIVVNNAGIIQVGPLGALMRTDFEEAMDIMFWAPMRVIEAALPQLRENGGHLVNITSVGGKISVPHLLPYSCAKFAAVALSEGLDASLAGEGVRVTTVVPGLMRTGSHRRAFFAGVPAREYAWFSALGAGPPPISMDAERAAARIVHAVRTGRSYLVLTPPARVAILVHGACPQVTQWGLRMMNRVLPASGEERPTSGLDASRRADNAFLRTLTRLGDDASRRFNQLSPNGSGEEAAQR
ncbi:SDR family NAD(P)-dependent oxidoreductase [Spinactinospora alkalitolerans]|nr:SDR family oxidoreductase [Spinactinospora alkalitolerans]